MPFCPRADFLRQRLARNKAYEAAISAQEKANLKGLTAKQIRTIKENPTALKTSSEEYITYKLKQNIIPLDFFVND